MEIQEGNKIQDMILTTNDDSAQADNAGALMPAEDSVDAGSVKGEATDCEDVLEQGAGDAMEAEVAQSPEREVASTDQIESQEPDGGAEEGHASEVSGANPEESVPESEKAESESLGTSVPTDGNFSIPEDFGPEMNMNFIPYNTDMEQLRLPEYGRKIQELIQYCKTIPDREERTACAYAISDVMARLFPGVVGEKGDRKKIWDHINIMAGFELDIDFPVEVLTQEELNPKPERIEYNKKPIRYRHYGRTLELMVEKAAEMEDCEQKDHLIMLIANQMKKQLLAHNKEGVSDAKVLKDLADYSKGRIVLDPQTYPLHEYNEVNNKQPQAKKKRKK